MAVPEPAGARPVPALPIPRPEHPRPDFRRDQWLNLNGWWDFAFDPEDRGQAEGWSGSQADFPERILVPFPWESPAAWGEADEATEARFYHERAYREPVTPPAIPVREDAWHRQHNAARRQEIGWYRRRFVTPAAWLQQGRRVFLVLGACDWEATVYCNGVPVGEHAGGYDSWSVELTGQLRAEGEDNLLVVRARDPQDHGDQPGGKQHWWYERTSGIWQTVYLEARPEAYLTHLRVVPDVVGRRATVEVGVCPVAGNYEIRVAATSPQGELASAQVVCPGCERRSVELDLGPAPALWSPDSPQLYELTVEVAAPAAGEVATDTVHSYFGLRQVGVGTLPDSETPCLVLNGRPLYLRAALHQSFHPAGVYSYVDDQLIREDLEAARAAGLNALRIHIKVDDPRLYYWADRLGICILYDLPNTGRQNAHARRLWEATLRAAVERDANHPSILLWVLFNETWGLGDPRDYRQSADTQAWVAEMVALCRRLDPTRLVEDNSPCNHDHVTTDVNSWHFYINDFARAREHIADAVAQTHPGSAWNYVPGRVQGSEPLINSEYGGIGAGDGDRDVSFCLKWLTQELRRHEKISGYVYTELTDIEWEHNGLLRYDRLPKHFPYPLRDVLGADVLVVDAPPVRHADAGTVLTIPVLASVFSGRPAGSGRLCWSLAGWSREGLVLPAATGERPVCWRAFHVTALADLAIPLPSTPGRYRVELELWDAAGTRVAGTWTDVLVGTWTGGLPELRAEGFRRVEAQGEYWVAEGPGTVRCRLERRGGPLVLEAAAGVHLPRQTDAVRTPSTVAIMADGRQLGTFVLPDAPADAWGVLSYANGLPGPYGYLLRMPLPSGRGPLEVELRAGSGGLALFGPNAGAYPVGLEVAES